MEEPEHPDPLDPLDPLEAATRAAASLEGLSAETTARVPQLLEAMCSVGAGRGLHATLDRICSTAAELVGARYAAIGVVDELGDGLSDFVTYGVDADTARRIGHRPDGHTGLLGALISHPEAIRLADLTKDPRAAGFPPGHPPMRTFLGVPVRGQGEVYGNFYLAEKTGTGKSGAGRSGGTEADGTEADGTEPAEPRPVEFTDHDLHMLRVLATEAGIAIGNARLYEAARQRERWIDGSVAVTTALLSGGSTEDALNIVAEQARRLSDAAMASVMLRTPNGELEVVAVSADRPRVRPGYLIPAESPAAAALLAGEAVIVEDARSDPRVITELASLYGPIMLLPLRTDGRVLGALVMPRERGAVPFGERERTLAGQFASQAALALMMAGAQHDRERLAVLQDRDRIARDLHDLVIQRLHATGMMLESAQRGTVAPEVHQGIDQAVEALDVTIQEIRAAIFALQQGPAEALSGVRTRVLREINMAAVPLGFTPTYRFVGPIDAAVGEPYGKNLIAALREALSNAFRHARASRIEVVVDATAQLADGRRAVRLTVADDGVGIPAGGRRSGLRNLRRRAESLGGASWSEPGLGRDTGERGEGGEGGEGGEAEEAEERGGAGGATVIWEVPL